MAFRKQGKKWVVRRHTFKQLPTRRDAEMFDLLLESAFAEAERKYANQVMPCCRIRDRLDEFLSDSEIGLRRRPCNPETLRLHRKRLLIFDAAFHSRPLDTITREDLERWIRRRMKSGARRGSIAPDTVNADLVSLRAFAKWAQGKGYAPALLPFLTVGRLHATGKVASANRKTPKALEMAEVLSLVSLIRRHRADIALLLEGMVLFCLRPSALCRLRRSDLKLPVRGSPGRLVSVGLKGHYDRELPIFPGSEQHAWAVNCIALTKRVYRRPLQPNEPLLMNIAGRSRKNPGGWTTACLDKALARLCESLGVKFTPYQIRHSAISWLQQTPGMSPAATQAAAAHSSITTQDIYGKRHGREAVPAFQALSTLMAEHRVGERSREGKGGDVSG